MSDLTGDGSGVAGGVALVTGATTGLGFETCHQLARRGWSVWLTGRDQQRVAASAAALQDLGLDVIGETMDVGDPASVEHVRHRCGERHGRLDALVNNAMIGFLRTDRAVGSDLSTAASVFDTNVLGPWRTTQIMLPLLRAAGGARIVNVSSTGGSFSARPGLGLEGVAAYAVSKAALNALTVKLANELANEGILVNAVSPGYTSTRPEFVGGRPIDEGAAGIVWAATLPADGPTGGFFEDGRAIDW